MKRSSLVVLGAFASVVAVGWGYQAGTKLFLNGSLASNGVMEKNGVAYVPLKDVAAALKMNLTKGANGWELAPPGGATMVEGVNGKVGDVLWNGAFRFRVVKVIRGKEYINQFSGDKQKVTPLTPDKDVVVLVCRLKSGLKDKVTVFLPSGDTTGLTDDQERSVGPRTGLSIDCPTRGAELIPGSAVDFALTFDVPTDAKLKDLVYEVSSTAPAAFRKKTFRVKVGE